jgi:alpha-L-arabinofuranosidase
MQITFKGKTLFKRLLTAACCILSTAAVNAQQGKSQAAVTVKQISPDLFGLFFEDINYAADGGLYAELVQNRSFEYNPNDNRGWHPLSYWEYVTPGYAYGTINVETTAPLNANNPHYVTLTAEHIGEGGIGLKNKGFDGIVLNTGSRYRYSFFGKLVTRQPVQLQVSLQTPKGKIIAEQTVQLTDNQWKKYSGTLVPTEICDSASLVVLAKTKGKLALDVISLFPEQTFKNRPNGMRADLAQLLAAIKPRFIRFPGGCLAHGDGLGNMYRWKNTIGPIEQRVEQRNIWNYHQTVGLGYFEYFQFCEDIGAQPLPVLPAAVSCQNSGGTWRIGGTGQQALPLDEVKDYIQEVLDLIEWANGPATSPWGRKRAEAGHPAPFGLKYVGIGNEDKITPEFKERFTLIYNAVKAKHPEITVIGTAGPFPKGEDFEKGWKLADQLGVPIIDEHYYQNPEWFLGNQYRYDRYDRKSASVYLGEYASWGNKLFNALAEAAYMTGLERNGDIVKLASYAPLLAKNGFTQWKTDMIYFDNKQAYPSVNYYVQKLFSNNAGNEYFSNVVKDLRDTLFAASCVRDNKTGDVIIKLVNAGSTAKNVQVDLSYFKNLNTTAVRTELSGTADAVITGKEQGVLPVVSAFRSAKKFNYTVKPMSLTVIRFSPDKNQSTQK